MIPALRERREDIPVLVHHFVQKYARRMKKRIDTIPATALNAMSQYHWPGNVRELENFIDRSVILSRETVLQSPLSELSSSSIGSSAKNFLSRKEAVRQHVLRALEEARWVIGGPAGAAARLGMKRSTLNSLLKRNRMLTEPSQR